MQRRRDSWWNLNCHRRSYVCCTPRAYIIIIIIIITNVLIIIIQRVRFSRTLYSFSWYANCSNIRRAGRYPRCIFILFVVSEKSFSVVGTPLRIFTFRLLFRLIFQTFCLAYIIRFVCLVCTLDRARSVQSVPQSVTTAITCLSTTRSLCISIYTITINYRIVERLCTYTRIRIDVAIHQLTHDQLTRNVPYNMYNVYIIGMA